MQTARFPRTRPDRPRASRLERGRRQGLADRQPRSANAPASAFRYAGTRESLTGPGFLNLRFSLGLAEKNRPIFQAALAFDAIHLVTRDLRGVRSLHEPTGGGLRDRGPDGCRLPPVHLRVNHPRSTPNHATSSRPRPASSTASDPDPTPACLRNAGPVVGEWSANAIQADHRYRLSRNTHILLYYNNLLPKIEIRQINFL